MSLPGCLGSDGQQEGREARQESLLKSDISPMVKGNLGKDLGEMEAPISPLRRVLSTTSLGGYIEKNIYQWEPKSLRIKSINFYHVFIAQFMPYVYMLTILLVLWRIIAQIASSAWSLAHVWRLASDPMLLEIAIAAGLIIAYIVRMTPSVYCMESCVFVPPEDWRVSKETLMTMMKAQGSFTEGSMDFLKRLLANSGTGESTAWPPSYMPCADGVTKGSTSVGDAREEARLVILPLVQQVLERTGVKATEIDFLIINCSLFSPTPSLCALVSNEFKMREDIRTYNLGGMGCSANVIAVDLAKQLLQQAPGSRALVISTENLTQNLYTGNEKGMLLQNTLFRCGGCALLLSSRFMDARRAKYKLLHTFRAQASQDNSYNCVFQQTDQEGNLGICLSKDIVKVAGKAMTRNFIQLGPYVLPYREQIKVMLNWVAINFVRSAKKLGLPLAKNWQAPAGYTPNFSKGIEHFCIHAGGRAVIEGVQKNLNLTDDQIKPSMQTLYDFGNTSSSSVWYETEWVERHAGLKPGDRILQIAFGSGFKCNSAVWVALRVDKSKRGVHLKE